MDVRATPRIAFYLPSFERGGVERLVINLSQPLLDRGVAVDVLVREGHPPTLDQLPTDVRVIDLEPLTALSVLGGLFFPKHVANAFDSIPDYVSYLVDEQPDLVVSMQTSPFAVFGTLLSRNDTTIAVRESNTPSVATSSPPHRIGHLAPFAKRLTYNHVDHVIAVSADAAADMTEWLGIPRDKIKVIYNPTSNVRVKERGEDPVSHPWFGADQPVIVSVGRFSDQKDFETLLHAMARTETEPRLILVGDGPNRHHLESLVQQQGIDNRVDFVGFQNIPYPYMANADLFVLSSNYEGLPNVLIEALTVGTPVVASDCKSGPREILLDGKGGYLVPVGDPDAMATAIDRALRNTEETEARLARAQEGLHRFTPETAADAYLSLLDETE